MSEWTDYRIRFPGSKGDLPYVLGAELTTVHHVVHIPVARRILEDGHIRAGLVYDESKLNKSRIAVSWLSANTWANGSIYGNVRFTFPWDAIMKGRRFYWVEVMKDYRPHAYRILMTDRDLTRSKYVEARYIEAYEPTSAKGPLRERNGEWYWNDQYTSEFMIESDIDLAGCTDFDFIQHHPEYCRPDGSACRDRSRQTHWTAGKMIAFILGHGIHSVDHVLKKPSIFDASRALAHQVDQGIDGIVRQLGGRKAVFGGPIKNPQTRKAVTRGALALYGSGQAAAARDLVATLKDKDTFLQGLTDVVSAHFAISDWVIDPEM